MYLQSIKSVKHNAAKSVNSSILKKSRHIRFGVFIVHSSMVARQPLLLTAGRNITTLSPPRVSSKNLLKVFRNILFMSAQTGVGAQDLVILMVT
jgi:hypothetical protein